MTDKSENLSKSMKNVFKGFFVLIIFFFINLFISVKSKHESAYSVLTREYEKSQLKLQDTRVHNWSELDKKKWKLLILIFINRNNF